MTARDILLLAIALVAQCDATKLVRTQGSANTGYFVYTGEPGESNPAIRIFLFRDDADTLRSVHLDGFGLSYRGFATLGSPSPDDMLAAFDSAFAGATLRAEAVNRG